MFAKVFFQAACVVCFLSLSNAVYSDVCVTSDGLLFSSTDKTVSKFNYLSSGCRYPQGVVFPERPHESPQLKLYDGQGVASVSLVANAPVSFGRHHSNVIPQLIAGDADFVEEIYATAEYFNIDPLLLHAIAHVESRHNPNAVSPAGARGLMQIMPATARQFGLTGSDQQLFDPVENLKVSATYLRNLYDLFGNNLDLVLAAYNAGEQAVIRYDYQIPPYQETQQYVALVMDRYRELMQSATQF